MNMGNWGTQTDRQGMHRKPQSSAELICNNVLLIAYSIETIETPFVLNLVSIYVYLI